MHYQTPYVLPRFNYGGSNHSESDKTAVAPDVSPIGASNSLSDAVNTRDRRQDSTVTLPPIGDTVPSPIAHAHLAAKSSNQLNTPISPDRLACLTHTHETLKRGAPDDNNFDICKFKKPRSHALKGEPMKDLEVQIEVGGDTKSDNCEKPVSKRMGSMAGGSSRNVLDALVGRLLWYLNRFIVILVLFSLSCNSNWNFKLID